MTLAKEHVPRAEAGTRGIWGLHLQQKAGQKLGSLCPYLEFGLKGGGGCRTGQGTDGMLRNVYRPTAPPLPFEVSSALLSDTRESRDTQGDTVPWARTCLGGLDLEEAMILGAQPRAYADLRSGTASQRVREPLALLPSPETDAPDNCSVQSP